MVELDYTDRYNTLITGRNKMTKYILIDDEDLKILKAAEGKEPLNELAGNIIPHKDYRIVGVDNKCFSVYSHYEVRRLLYGATGTMRSEHYSYGKLIHEVANFCRELPIINPLSATADDVVEETPTVVAAPPQPPLADESLPKPQEEKPKKPKKPAGRPKPGTKTAMVWDTADAVKAANPDLAIGDKLFRQAVVDACMQADIKKPTIATQFGKWKKFQVEQLT